MAPPSNKILLLPQYIKTLSENSVSPGSPAEILVNFYESCCSCCITFSWLNTFPAGKLVKLSNMA